MLQNIHRMTTWSTWWQMWVSSSVLGNCFWVRIEQLSFWPSSMPH